MLQDAEPPCQNPYTVNAHVLGVAAEQYSGITTDGWFSRSADKELQDRLAKQRVRRDAAKIVNKALKNGVKQGKADEKERQKIEKMKREVDALERENKKLRSKKAALGL